MYQTTTIITDTFVA